MDLTAAAEPLVPKFRKVLLPLLAILWFVASIAFSSLVGMQFSGFPDGYITPYARDIGGLLLVLTIACYAQSLYFLVIGFRPRRTTFSRFGFGILLAAIFVIVPMMLVVTCPNIGACTAVYETMLQKSMDDGQGG